MINIFINSILFQSTPKFQRLSSSLKTTKHLSTNRLDLGELQVMSSTFVPRLQLPDATCKKWHWNRWSTLESTLVHHPPVGDTHGTPVEIRGVFAFWNEEKDTETNPATWVLWYPDILPDIYIYIYISQHPPTGLLWRVLGPHQSLNWWPVGGCWYEQINYNQSWQRPNKKQQQKTWSFHSWQPFAFCHPPGRSVHIPTGLSRLRGFIRPQTPPKNSGLVIWGSRGAFGHSAIPSQIWLVSVPSIIGFASSSACVFPILQWHEKVQ